MTPKGYVVLNGRITCIVKNVEVSFGLSQSCCSRF